MRKRLNNWIALPVLSALVLVGNFSCGDGDSKPLEPGVYRDALISSQETLENKYETEGEARLLQFEEDNDYPIETLSEFFFQMMSGNEDWSEENLKELSRISFLVVDYFQLVLEIHVTFSDEFHETLSSLEPPSHLAKLHDDLLAAYKAELDLFIDFSQQIDLLRTDHLPIEGELDADRFYANFAQLVMALETLGMSGTVELTRLCWEMEDELSSDLGELVSLDCGPGEITGY